MRIQKQLSRFGAAVSAGLLIAPLAIAQYAPTVDPWYGGYNDEGYYEDAPYYGYQDRYYEFDEGSGSYFESDRRQTPEIGVQRVLSDPRAEWEYEVLGDEWEIESVHGEVDYEPEGYFEPASREELERAMRDDLRGPGTWEYEALEGEWEYETPAGDEIEYEPGPNI